MPDLVRKIEIICFDDGERDGIGMGIPNPPLGMESDYVSNSEMKFGKYYDNNVIFSVGISGIGCKQKEILKDNENV